MTVRRWTRSIRIPIPNTCFTTELSLLNEISILLSTHNPTIVEFGTLLGGCTYAMAAGLNQRGMIHTFDNFKFQDWMHFLGQFDGMKYGDSFRHIAEENLTKHFGNVRLYTCDLIGYQDWDEPIDMIVIDAFKEIQIAEVTLPTFIPYLKKGGYLFDQDLGYNPVQFSYMVSFYYELRHKLKPVYLPWQGSGVMFEVVEPIKREEVNYIICDRFNNFSSHLVLAYQYFMEMGVFDKERTNACKRKNELFSNSPHANDKQFVSKQYGNSRKTEDRSNNTA